MLLLMLRLITLSVCLLALPAHTAFAQAAVTILYSSEHHGMVERQATMIQQIRKETEFVLVVGNGDVLVRTASIDRGKADIVMMNQMGYDAMAVNSHNFNLGIGRLKSLQQEATFPFLCTNVRPKKSDVCVHHAVKTVGTIRVGMIGVIGKTDTLNQEAAKEVDFHDPIVAARKAAEVLREGVELLVAITQQTTEEDLALARAIPALDVIIGGHADGFDGLLKPGESKPIQGRVDLVGVGPVYVKTQQGRTLGRLDLVLHDRTVMVGEARNLPVASTGD